MEDIKKKLGEAVSKRNKLLDQLLPFARAAVNQMEDAGMKQGAAPLKEIIFQIDALDQEAVELLKSPEGMEAFIDMLKR